MKRDANKIELTSVDDLFSTEESRAEARLEKIREIPVDKLFPFENHPFKVLDDDAMMETVESVKQYGVLVPGIVRPLENGCYEIISGHRRCRACELAGLETMPVIVREMDDDEAVILMVDSNLQRENILPSERAFAFKMKLEGMKIIRLAFNLYCESIPTAIVKEDPQELMKECREYTPNNIFCCAYAPYFWQAIRIRFPEYGGIKSEL